jgi:hypothetical protein
MTKTLLKVTLNTITLTPLVDFGTFQTNLYIILFPFYHSAGHVHVLRSGMEITGFK